MPFLKQIQVPPTRKNKQIRKLPWCLLKKKEEPNKGVREIVVSIALALNILIIGLIPGIPLRPQVPPRVNLSTRIGVSSDLTLPGVSPKQT